MGMKLGLVTYQVAAEWDAKTLIEACKEANFQGVELRATHAHGVEDTLSKDERAKVKKQFEDSGVELYGLGSAYDYHTPDQDKLKADIEASKRYLQLAADVGAEGIKVRPNGLPEGVDEAKTLEQIGLSVREVAKAGADLGVQVWLEVHGKETQRPDRMRIIMDHADHPNAYVTWNCNPNEPDVNGSVTPAFRLLEHKIGCVHFHELWEKSYPYTECFALLKGIGYNGWASYEGPGSADPKLLMKATRRLWELMQ